MSSTHPAAALNVSRLEDTCTAWLWCADAHGCTVSGGSQIQIHQCIVWNLDMLPLARPDPISPPSTAGQDMYNHTIGFMSGESMALSQNEFVSATDQMSS